MEEEVIIQQLAEITSSAKHFIPTFKKKPCLVFHLQDSALPIKPMGKDLLPSIKHVPEKLFFSLKLSNKALPLFVWLCENLLGFSMFFHPQTICL